MYSAAYHPLIPNTSAAFHPNLNNSSTFHPLLTSTLPGGLGVTPVPAQGLARSVPSTFPKFYTSFLLKCFRDFVCHPLHPPSSSPRALASVLRPGSPSAAPWAFL